MNTEPQFIGSHTSITLKNRSCILVASLLILYSSFSLADSYFSVPLILNNNMVDRSSDSWPWTYIGEETLIFERVERGSGFCTGIAPNGAPVLVRCNQPSYILGGRYVCPAYYRNLHVGDEVVGKLVTGSYSTGSSDGYNPDSCAVYNVGQVPVLTRRNQLYLAGGRWACPTGVTPIDLNLDGSTYNPNEAPTKANPEACGAYRCPIGTSLSYVGSNHPSASYYYQHFGYACKGDNKDKQPSDSCRVGNPIVVATGNKFQAETDFQSVQYFGLRFTRYFSANINELINAIGIKWKHSFFNEIVEVGGSAFVYRHDGQVLTYRYSNNWLRKISC